MMDDRSRTFECTNCYSVITIQFSTIGQACLFRFDRFDDCPVCGEKNTMNDIEKPKEVNDEKG